MTDPSEHPRPGWQVTHDNGEARFTGFEDPELALRYSPPVVHSLQPETHTGRAVGGIAIVVTVLLLLGLLRGDGRAIHHAPSSSSVTTTTINPFAGL